MEKSCLNQTVLASVITLILSTAQVEVTNNKGRVKKKKTKRVILYKNVGYVRPQNHISGKNEIVTWVG